ncbi:hypothetical protein STEG23_016264, partial [Scotinomys teguina]
REQTDLHQQLSSWIQGMSKLANSEIPSPDLPLQNWLVTDGMILDPECVPDGRATAHL